MAKTEKRITPAYAGQIYGSMPTSENDGDHPRIRGTNKAEVPLLSHPIGSPPHTRDKFFFVLAISDSLRITPAYAGQIHPVAMTVVLLVGSPPHTRDKLTAPPLFPCPFRITPAYAGQIRHSLILLILFEDHPRIRGTNLIRLVSVTAFSGSPPHTRDK